jgi:hypothetical protein
MKFLMLLVVLGVLGGGAYVVMGADSRPRSPQEQAFDAANRQIGSYHDTVGFGNTTEAAAIATSFSETAVKLDKMFFEGKDENRAVSMTKEHFLTWCQQEPGSVLFLVHVPQFKRYKDDVRESLLQMCWSSAKIALPEGLPEDTRLCIGLRGSVFYGGIAEGTLGSESPRLKTGGAVSNDPFHAYFAAPTATATTAASTATDSPSAP